MSEPVRRIEVFNGHGRRRSWSAKDKLAIVAESYDLGEIVCTFARRHGLARQQRFISRREARERLEAMRAPPTQCGCVPEGGTHSRRMWTSAWMCSRVVFVDRARLGRVKGNAEPMENDADPVTKIPLTFSVGKSRYPPFLPIERSRTSAEQGPADSFSTLQQGWPLIGWSRTRRQPRNTAIKHTFQYRRMVGLGVAIALRNTHRWR